MNLSSFTVSRPIFTIMVVLIVLILGGISLFRLPIDLMPDISNPTLSVITTYENAGPEEVESLITRPIEEALSAVPGVEEITSSSSEGASSVRVTFTWGTNLDTAANDVRDRLDRIAGRLPDDASRPILRKFDLAAFPIVVCGAYGKLDPVQLRQVIEDQVKNRIERVPGVAALDIWGGLERQIRVSVDGDKVKALGLSLESVLTRLRAENVNIPAGTIDRGNYEVLIRTPGEFRDLDELGQTVIAVPGGVAITLAQIAEVEDSWQRVRQIVRVNGEPGVRLSIQKQSGTNTVQVAQAALAELERIDADLPQVSLVPLMDTSKYIQRSISNVGRAAAYGGLLSILVLLFFLRNIRSTVVISTAIPVSVVATFALMYFGGFTLNIMTLGGLALGVGMLVDNSIVALENIYRHREAGASAERAAVFGSSEVAAAIVASTLTTIVVFLPLLFVRGMAGVMYRQLAIVVGFALLCSLAAALTLVPMLSAKVLGRPRSSTTPAGGLIDRLFRFSERLFAGLESAYESLLRAALNHRIITILAALLLLAGSLLLFPLIGSELMPQADEGEVRLSAEMEVGTRIGMTDEMMTRIEQIVLDNVPEIEAFVTTVGGGMRMAAGGSPHLGEMRIVLKSQRERSSEQVAADLRAKLSGLPGVTMRVRAGQGLFLLRMGSSQERVEVEIRGHDLEIGDALAKRVEQVVGQVPGISDVRLSTESGSPEEQIIIDRRKAADMKLNVRQIASMLQTSLAGTRAGNFRESGDEYAILVQLKDAERMELDEVLDLTLVNAAGQPVVLRNVVEVRPRSGPVRIERKGQERVITVSANPADRDMGSILADIRQGLVDVPVPRNFSITFGGDFEEQQEAFRELLLSFGLALLLVYMVMACQFESIRDPFVVMFAVPLAAIGVLVVLFMTNTTFNIQSYIGCIMLGGIVVNNAILLVDQTNLARRRDGLPLREAIETVGRRRLRPILMTASTTILGLLPLALGLGEGGEAQAPMARAVIGGLLSATLITLLIVPVMYSIFERRMSYAAHVQDSDKQSSATTSGQPLAADEPG